MSNRRGLVLAAVILVGAGVLAWILFATAPSQEKHSPETPAPVVGVRPLVSGRHPVTIEAFGTVSPARSVVLAPQIEGRVIEVFHELAPGAIVEEGVVLFRISPEDHRIALRRAEAALAQARADLALEEGRQTVAAREWERYADSLQTLDPEELSPGLARREPQLQQARARVAAAEATLEEAQLQLRRTAVRAPFGAFVQEESLEVGKRVAPGETVVSLAGIDTFWAIASMPAERARRLSEVAPGSPVRVHLEGALDPGGEPREGRFVRWLPALAEQGRMARALVAIDDPLALEGGSRNERAPSRGAARPTRIPMGSYVRVEIPAGAMEGVFEIPREALRENGIVWVRDADGKLRFRDVRVVWRRDDSVLARVDIEPGDALITTYLSDPLPGLELRVREAGDEPGGPRADDEPIDGEVHDG